MSLQETLRICQAKVTRSGHVLIQPNISIDTGQPKVTRYGHVLIQPNISIGTANPVPDTDTDTDTDLH
jgi:hypothetical protein